MAAKRASGKAKASGKPDPDEKKGGRAGENYRHSPTEQTRNLVSLCMLNEFTHEQTAKLCGFSEATLKRHYVDELQHGKSRMLARVAANLYSIAMQTADRKAALTASIFLLKSKGGYNDRAGEMASGKDPDAAPLGSVVKFELHLGETKRLPEDT